MSSEKLAVADLEKRSEEKRVQEIDWEQFLENRTLQQPLPSNRGGYEELPPIEQNLTKGASLVDHLRWQMQLSDFTEDEKRLAELVLGNLDDNGFLDLKGMDRENGEKTPDLTIEDLAERSRSTRRTRSASSGRCKSGILSGSVRDHCKSACTSRRRSSATTTSKCR